MEGSAQPSWGPASGFTGVLRTTAGRVCLLGLALIAGAGPLRAVSASTAPAGFVRATVAGAEAPGRQAASLIASPLLNSPVFSGRIAQARAASGATEIVSQSHIRPGPDCFDARKPHAVFVTSGVFAGFVFRVTANDAEGITVENQGFDLGQILAPGDAFDVRPLHTFKTLFGADAASVPFGASADAASADQFMLSRDGVWRTYWFTGSVWRRTGTAGDAGDDVILPQDGIVVYRRAASALQVRFEGEVPATDAVVSVPTGLVSTVANPFPTDAAIGEFGFETVSGWRSSPVPDQADLVQVCDGPAWRTFWHDGVAWKNSGSPSADPTISAGTGMVVVRRAGSSPNPYALISRPYDL